MTAVLYDEVVTVAPALRVVRDTDTIHDTIPAPAPKKVTRGAGQRPSGDPLVDGAARLVAIPLRHLYAALWRVGVLEVQV